MWWRTRLLNHVRCKKKKKKKEGDVYVLIPDQ